MLSMVRVGDANRTADHDAGCGRPWENPVRLARPRAGRDVSVQRPPKTFRQHVRQDGFQVENRVLE